MKEYKLEINIVGKRRVIDRINVDVEAEDLNEALRLGEKKAMKIHKG